MDSRHSHRGLVALLIALPLVFIATVAVAALAVMIALVVTPGAPEAAALPTGAEICDRYVEATGGVDAYAKITSRKITAVFEIPAQMISFDMTVWSARPNLVYTVMTNPAFGAIESGVSPDGVVWDRSVMTGPVIRQGEEREMRLADAQFEAMGRWREIYESAECTGEDTLEAGICWTVKLAPKSGIERTVWFSKETGLVERMDMSIASDAGVVPMSIMPGDYRVVDGLLTSHRVVVRVLGQERVVTTKTI
ncbi:MAG: hypothetical protein PHQ19_08875 [Candidatus Krumholzibacteria bacterium]|nr:hypothetical protein [Candidatus Krumholzibacteria bacterium]